MSLGVGFEMSKPRAVSSPLLQPCSSRYETSAFTPAAMPATAAAAAAATAATAILPRHG